MYALQAITTKYLGPTNTRGARIKATADAGSITIPWDHELNAVKNHYAVASAFALQWGWTDDSTGTGTIRPHAFGALPCGGYVMAFLTR
jgi:hypothetical protein